MAKEEVNNAWKKFIQGDKHAYGIIYQAYFPLLTMFCLGKLKDIEEAENCASEALYKTMKYERPEEIRDLHQWLFSVARNLCYSLVTTSNRRQDIIQDISYDAAWYQTPEVEAKYKLSELENILNSNLKGQDHVIWQLHIEGYSNKEIGVKLNLQEKTVANRKSAIRELLRKTFKSLF